MKYLRCAANARKILSVDLSITGEKTSSHVLFGVENLWFF
jgi:hypothetical protein